MPIKFQQFAHRADQHALVLLCWEASRGSEHGRASDEGVGSFVTFGTAHAARPSSGSVRRGGDAREIGAPGGRSVMDGKDVVLLQWFVCQGG